jgi:hypothetical protein
MKPPDIPKYLGRSGMVLQVSIIFYAHGGTLKKRCQQPSMMVVHLSEIFVAL